MSIATIGEEDKIYNINQILLKKTANINITNVELAKDKLKEVLMNYEWEQIIVGFSGGKDSTATLQLLIDTCVENEISIPIRVLSSNTLIENPLIENQLLEVQKQIKKINEKTIFTIEHNILIPNYNDSFFVNTIVKGYATPLSSMGRWCTRALKVDPMEKYYKNINQKTLVLSGVRLDESTLRRRNVENYFKNEVQKDTEYIYKYAPIKEFKLKDIWDYIMDIFRSDEYYINNNTLWEIYKDGTTDDVCPSSVDMSISKEKVSSCGKSRYGCYMCPLVSKDKALEANIKNGRKELRGYLELRNWYMDRCYDPVNRSRFTRRGTVKLKELKVNDIGDFDFKMLYTRYKGNIHQKKDYNDRTIIVRQYNEDYAKVIKRYEKYFKNDLILIFEEYKDGEYKYYRPTTAQLKKEFRIELYNKILEVEEKYKVEILRVEERELIEGELNERAINYYKKNI